MRVLIILAAFLSVPVLGQSEYKEFVGSGGVVNWSNGTVSAEGNGLGPEGGNPKTASLLACRAAIANAQRNLLEAAQGVRVTSTTQVQDFVLQSDEVRTSVEGVVQGATIVDRKLLDSGVCRVDLRMAMGGEMSDSLYQSTFRAPASISRRAPGEDFFASIGRSWRKLLPITLAYAAQSDGERAQQAPPSQVPAADGWTSAYHSLSDRLSAIEKKLDIAPTTTLMRDADVLPTGLVVDSRGSNFIPSLSPNIRQIRGNIIYPDKGAQDSILGSGQLVALFARDVKFAMRHPRVGERPLLVKALRTWGDTRTEVVLGTESSEKVIALAKTRFFDGAGVIIVLD